MTEGELKKGEEENEEGLPERIRKMLRRVEEDGRVDEEMVAGMVEEIEGRVRHDDSGMEEEQVNAVMAELVEEVVIAMVKCSERTVAEVKCEDAIEIERALIRD